MSEFAPIGDPTISTANQQPPSPEEQRRYLEEAMAGAVTELFEQNAGFSEQLPNGGQKLNMYLPTTEEGRKNKVLRFAQDPVGSDGIRTTYMSYLGSGWWNHVRLTETPDSNPKLEECWMDPETKHLSVIPKPDLTAENPYPYDHTDDGHVANLALTWLNNTKEAMPVKPLGAFGRLGVKALSRFIRSPRSGKVGSGPSA